jgi:hypothetical protein
MDTLEDASMFEIAQEHVKSHSQDGLDFVIGLIQDSVCPCYHAPSQHTVMLTYYASSFTRNRTSVLCHRRRLVLMKLVPVLSSPSHRHVSRLLSVRNPSTPLPVLGSPLHQLVHWQVQSWTRWTPFCLCWTP